jgi:hypothetical protein
MSKRLIVGALAAAGSLAVAAPAGTAHAKTIGTAQARQAALRTAAGDSALACKRNPGHDLKLKRSTIKKRGWSWVKAKVPYSQTSYHCNGYGTYRQDCSGFVSLAWGLHTSHWTGSLLSVSKYVKRKNIKVGDAVTHYPKSSAHGHVMLVTQPTKKGTWVYTEPHTGSHAQRKWYSWHYLNVNHYYGIRYKNVR